jgi:hypothetical protein
MLINYIMSLSQKDAGQVCAGRTAVRISVGYQMLLLNPRCFAQGASA